MAFAKKKTIKRAAPKKAVKRRAPKKVAKKVVRKKTTVRKKKTIGVKSIAGITKYIAAHKKQYIALFDDGKEWQQATFEATTLTEARRFAAGYKREMKLRGSVKVRLKK